MATYASFSDLDESLVRKALTGSLFSARSSAVAITRTNLFATTAATATAPATSSLATRPAGYNDGGITTDDGIRFARSAETEDITGWQRREPVRSDVTSDSETLQVDFEETSKTTIELYTGADLSAATLVNGALSIQKPALPPSTYFRLLALGVDNIDGDEFYIAVFYPRCRVTAWADQAFGKAGALQWGMTFTTYVDSTLGYAKDTMLGGPGYTALAASMGLPAA